MKKFLIILEKTETGFSAYCPDLAGCVATGRTKKEVKKNMYEAIKMHIKGLLEDRKPVPKTHTFSEYMVV